MGIPQNNQQDSRAKFQQLLDEGKPDEAASFMSDKLNKNFDDVEALYSLAHCYKEAERWGHAFNLYRAVASLTGGKADALNGMGLCLQEAWELDLAETLFRKALKDNPNHAHVLNNIGLVKLYKCEPEESLKWLNRALKIDPALDGASLNKAYCHLMMKNWSDGWADWVKILGRVKARTERGYEQDERLVPKWGGTKGQVVVVYGEQGIGDEVSFASCIPDLQKDCQVIIECDHKLEGLFKRSFGCHVYGTRFKGDPYSWLDNHRVDARVAIGDLPYFYRQKTQNFPGTPYLKADPERVLQWKALFDTFRKPVIGIAWSGGTDRNNTKARSVTLEDLEPVLRSIDATWVSLEYKDKSEEICAFVEKTGIRILDYPRATRTQDYDDTAGLLEACDLVFSVTTAVIHLAGSLGKECWCIAPERPRWFYGLTGDSLPWYKSVKMFRKKKDWPFQEISNLLRLRYGRGL